MAAPPSTNVKWTSDQDAIALLGTPSDVFQPATANMIAGVIIAFLMIGGGVALLGLVVFKAIQHGGNMPIWAEKDFSWGAGFIFGAVGLALLVGAIFLLAWIRKTLGLRVYICEKGLFYSLRGTAELFPWDRLAQIREITVHENLPIVKGMAKRAMPKITNRSYTVVRDDLVEYTFTGDHVKNVDRLGEILHESSGKHGIPWEIQEVQV